MYKIVLWSDSNKGNLVAESSQITCYTTRIKEHDKKSQFQQVDGQFKKPETKSHHCYLNTTR